MDHHLKCQLCGEKLQVTSNCLCTLGEHLLAKHPDVELTFFTSLENLLSWKLDLGEKARECNRKVISCRKLSAVKITKSSRSGSGGYKTTVETWKPAQLELACPQCRKKGQPSMRRHKNKFTNTSLGAFCMLSCWPACFLPFIVQKKSIVELYCKNCGTFLGEYNRATGTLSCICSKWNKKDI
ncbi:unnamed protein product [Diabrotica balteata]|uniref:LITAF domain-containing protein n=1 Tax=Diabrotica balteata TaxID=107213 RepID=A0A9N9T8U7_DIABA|nr:unnamed protein product [Diabrotica balteata]